MAKPTPEAVPAQAPDSKVPARLSTVLRELARVPEAELGRWEQALAPGVVVGRYELVREAGRGGFGVVYEARDVGLGRTVAFKAVKVAANRTELREERLLREAEAAARLSHPNIVTLFDAATGEHGPYLIHEFLRGQTLAQRLERGQVSVVEALRIAVGVARGLAHAHAKGVVHRDLTPGNVFLCDEGYVKILDFGMAHAFGQRRVEGGTPGYMAPEQRRGAPEDERTDVYALGVILYRMLANDLPFPKDADASPRPAPVLDVPGAPGLGEIVARMLEPDPVNRPRDAAVVLGEIAPLLPELERTPSTGRIVAARRRGRVRAGLAAGLAALVVAAGAAGAAVWRANRGPLTPRPLDHAAPSIAVLPFADLSPERDQEHFSDGLADELLNALARIDGLRVPGRTSSFYFKGRNARLADIGRELHVAAVLEGSVRLYDHRVRVTAQVVNVADGYRVWGQTYDREASDIFAVQYDIARSVADALHVKLLGEKAPAIDAHQTANPEVYAQFLLGRQGYHRGTREGYRLAVGAYEKALALQPDYAPAWAGLAIPLFNLAQDAKTPAAFAEQRRRALAAAEKAVALSPDLPDALSSRGILRALIDFDWIGARADLERALALNPADADARRRYGVLLMDLGRVPDAVAELRRAVDLDPLGQSWGTLGTVYQSAGDFVSSEAAFRRYLQFSPESVPGMLGLGRALLLERKAKDALAVFERCPADDHRLWGTAIAQQELGDKAAARTALDALTVRYGHTSAIRIAEVHAWRGEKDAAFQWLERALANPGGLGGQLRTNPFLVGLREDPRFAGLLRRMKLPVP